MIIYNGTKAEFDNDVNMDVLARKIDSLFWEKNIEHENLQEYISWKNSLAYMQTVLDDVAFSDDIRIAIEYQIPQTSKRVDFIIAGQNASGTDNLVVVELKQWEKAKKTRRNEIVRAVTGGTEKDVAHPSYQAYSYAKTIENFSAVIQDRKILIHPCAYLHNYLEEYRGEIDNEFYRTIVDESPLYLQSDADSLRSFIKRYVTRPPKNDTIYEIDNGRIRPSKALQDAIGSMLDGNEEFYMIDEQKVVYETIKRIIELVIRTDQKCTVIVEGGPGTGKSVVAIQLLVDLIRQQKNVQYVTKNAAPRHVYFEMLKREAKFKGYVKTLFQSSSNYINTPANTFDCLLVDESHRLNARSFRGFGYAGENQIKEIINAARVSVFFIDEDQIVTANDIGTIEEIKKWANQANSQVYHNESTKLLSQFRCNGSNGYLAFIDDLLDIRKTANRDGFDSDYELKLFDDPCKMREELRELNRINNKARMVAGYCYEWKSKADRKGIDITLKDGFEAQWNFNNTETWAVDPESFDQVGCIHTCQGLEFDYVGVIIGKDLLYRDGQVITCKENRAKTDFSLRGAKKRGIPDLEDRIIRNTYKVLLTRGQKGCFIFCEDEKLQEYFQSRLSI